MTSHYDTVSSAPQGLVFLEIDPFFCFYDSDCCFVSLTSN